MEIVSASQEVPSCAQGPPQFAFTGADLQWALRLLKLLKSKADGLMVTQAVLAKLASRLYSMKTPFGRSPPPPSVRAAIARSLTASVVTFRPGLEGFLPTGVRAVPGERMVVLRQLRPEERLEVPRGADGERESLQMALSASALVEVAIGVFEANSTAREKAEAQVKESRMESLEVRACA